MTKTQGANDLRTRAQARLTATGGDSAPEPSIPDMQRLVHELKVHQIELELQNEELLQARGEVEAGLARYADLYEHAPIGYLTLAGDGEILQLNLAAARLLGTERARLVGRRLGILLAVDQRPAFNGLLTSIARTPGRSTCEVHLVRDGVTAILELAGVAIAGSDRSRVVATDVTEARRAAAAVRDSEARYRTLFELSRDALVTLAPPSWRFTSGNAAALALFGVADEGQLRARTMSESSPNQQPGGGDSAALTELHLTPAMRDGARIFDWTLRRSDGVDFPATVSLTRMVVDGAPILQAAVRDETEARARQAHLAQGDRLASLGMMAASVAHEVNNPLAYVLYNLETLNADLPGFAAAVAALRASTDALGIAAPSGPATDRLGKVALDDVVERAAEALRGTLRIRDVVRGLATFSRVEGTETRRVDVKHAVGAALDLASNELHYCASVVTELGEVPAVRASEGKLSQVLLNLLINAAHAFDDHSPDDPRITVRTWTDGADACIAVADNGCGIAPETLAHIFEPFFTTKGVGRGSGLGLAICRNLVAELGGTVTVESARGVGTTFVVRLPAFAATKDPQPTTAAPEPPVPRIRGRVLVVDDEPAIRRALARLLGDTHEVVLAASGAEAQSILTVDTAFDVILCDLMMPGMTGMQLHTWLQGHARALAARVVFVTGGAFTPRAAEYLEKAGNLQIEKPFDSAYVKFLVSELVAAARS
jgi:PAS domain S-box-containing protein